MQESSDVPLVRCLGSILFWVGAYCIENKRLKKADYTVSEAIQKGESFTYLMINGTF
jgi:pectin methylesterase-like acyl-CoA thioesterase